MPVKPYRLAHTVCELEAQAFATLAMMQLPSESSVHQRMKLRRNSSSELLATVSAPILVCTYRGLGTVKIMAATVSAPILVCTYRIIGSHICKTFAVSSQEMGELRLRLELLWMLLPFLDSFKERLHILGNLLHHTICNSVAQ